MKKLILAAVAMLFVGGVFAQTSAKPTCICTLQYEGKIWRCHPTMKPGEPSTCMCVTKTGATKSRAELLSLGAEEVEAGTPGNGGNGAPAP